MAITDLIHKGCLWDTWGTVTNKVDCTSIDISATTMAEHMPQNWTANQQFYIQVVQNIYDSTGKRKSVEPRVTFALRQHVCTMTHTGTNQFVCLFVAEKQNTLKHTLCLTASSLLQIGHFVHKTHF